MPVARLTSVSSDVISSASLPQLQHAKEPLIWTQEALGRRLGVAHAPLIGIRRRAGRLGDLARDADHRLELTPKGLGVVLLDLAVAVVLAVTGPDANLRPGAEAALLELDILDVGE